MPVRKGWDKDLKDGLANEDRIEQCLRFGKIEVKRDWEACNTGNVFVEVSGKRGGSGLQVTEADHWCFTIGSDDSPIDICLRTPFLIKMVKYFAVQKGVMSGGDDNSARGVLVPVEAFVKPQKYGHFESLDLRIPNTPVEVLEQMKAERLAELGSL